MSLCEIALTPGKEEKKALTQILGELGEVRENVMELLSAAANQYGRQTPADVRQKIRDAETSGYDGLVAKYAIRPCHADALREIALQQKNVWAGSLAYLKKSSGSGGAAISCSENGACPKAECQYRPNHENYELVHSDN